MLQVDNSLRETEAWFVEHGLPSFSRRAVPRSEKKVAGLLTLISVLEVGVAAPSTNWAWWLDLLAMVVAPVGAAVAVSAGIKAESAKNRSGLWRFLSEAVFVIAPAVFVLVLSGVSAMILVAGVNLLVLGGLYTEQRWRPLAVVRWCLNHAAGQVRSATRYLSRSVPLLTVLVLSLFYTTEVWQAASDMKNANLATVVFVLSGAGVVYSVVQVRSGLAKYIHETDTTEQLRGTPAENLEVTGAPEVPLTPGEDLNVNVLLVASQLCIAAVTALAFSLLIVLFGSVAITPGVIQAWTGHAPRILFEVNLWVSATVSTELLALGALMTGVSSLVFAVSLSGEQAFQDSTKEELSSALSAAFAARNVYLAALESRT